MRTSLPGILTILVVWGSSPITALAACEDYPLTPAQLDYLEGQSLDLIIPEGDVPIVQRCDINDDNVVDMNDIRAISYRRNQPAAHPDDPMDWDKNNWIDIYDARGCQLACTLPRCAISAPLVTQVDGVIEEAECFQVEDLDGDGKEDFVGIAEHTGGERGGDWTLEVVILNEDEEGNVQSITYPYTGQKSEDGGEIFQHLSMQPAGEVNLLPGSLTIEEPAVVSYRHGEPAVIYYWQDGKINRAFYKITD